MNNRFRKTERMKRRVEITRMFRHAGRAGDRRMKLLAMSNAASTLLVRGGVTVSVRHGNAVCRNRIKRLCREAFRLEKRNLPAGFDFILVPRIGVELDRDGLRHSLRNLAGRAIGASIAQKGGKRRSQ